MFGDPVPRPAAAPAPAPPRSQAERLFGDAPEKYLDLKDGLTKLGDAAGLTVEQQQEEARDFAKVAVTDLRLDRTDVHRLFDLSVDARLKGSSEAWTTQAARWPEQSRRQLREQFGAQEGEHLAAGIESFIESRPDLAKRLQGGLRSHPDVTRMLVPIVRKLGGYGAA